MDVGLRAVSPLQSSQGSVAARTRPTGVTVLITGFGPFPGAPFNPTEALVRRLAARRRPALAEVARHAHVFQTSYTAIDRELPGLIKQHAPEVLLMFGLAARTPYLRIEMQARNTVSVLVPDAGGRMLRARSIRAGEPTAAIGSAPFHRLLNAACGARVPVRLSRNAGTYLCNYVYWRGIEANEQNGTPRIVVFVHVPNIARAARTRGSSRRLTLDDLVRAGEAILVALVSAGRPSRLGARPSRLGARRVRRAPQGEGAPSTSVSG
jgi:pyroglutamyl-peptidase